MRTCDFEKWNELEEVVLDIESQIKRLTSLIEDIKCFECGCNKLDSNQQKFKFFFDKNDQQ